jgi:hypothetical protein
VSLEGDEEDHDDLPSLVPGPEHDSLEGAGEGVVESQQDDDDYDDLPALVPGYDDRSSEGAGDGVWRVNSRPRIRERRLE